MNINKQISDVAGIAIAPPQVSATVEASSNGTSSFSGVVTSRKGQPFTIISVDKDNWRSKLGEPFHMKEGFQPEGLRQLEEALAGGIGYVVRIVGDDATYPSVAINAESSGKNPTTKTNEKFHDGLTPSTTGDIGSFFVIDGDTENRTVSIKAADVTEYGADLFELTIHKGSDKNGRVLEKHIVSFKFGAKLFGVSSFIEDVLNGSSKIINFEAGDTVADFKAMDDVTIACNNGSSTLSGLSAAYGKAVPVLRQMPVQYTHVLSLGVYDDAYLAQLKDVAYSRNIQGFVDIEPNLSYSAALTRAQGLALNSFNLSLLHFPYSANDPFFGGRSLFGVSGAAFAAKSKGIDKAQPTGGWHNSFAGLARGVISRGGLQLNENAGEPDYEAMVKARINKVASNSAGALMFDDTLTTWLRADHLRFEHVVSVDLAISRDMYRLFEQVKHEPDGVTRAALERGVNEVLDRYVTSEALMPPSNPEDGDQPYVVVIEKLESDLWSIRWDLSITGIARRIIGTPRHFS